MEKLVAQDYEKIKEAIFNYNQLNKEGKKQTDEIVCREWDKMFDKYMSLCKNDKNWINIKINTKLFEKNTKFNWEDHYRKCVGGINLDDPEFRELFFEYDPKKHQEEADIYNQIGEYRTNINSQIDKINNQHFVLGKKIKINRLQNKLSDLERKANHYAELKQRDDLKNKTEMERSSYEVEKMKLKKIEYKYATDAVLESLKINPVLVCAYPIDFVISTSVRTNVNGETIDLPINSDILKEVFSDICLKALGLSVDKNHDTELTR